MRSVKNWALATFILTFLVIIAGGVVRTTQSGMGCPDWPKCFGSWIPPTTIAELPPDFEKYLGKQDIDHSFNALHTWIEYFNRLLGALLGVFAIVQLALIYRFREQERKAFRYSSLFLLTVILTGLFGAIVVKLNLAHASISVHLLFAIVLIQLQLAVLLALKQKLKSILIDKKLFVLLLAMLLLILTQATLGTMVRIYIDDISKQLNYQSRADWLLKYPVAFVMHRSFSWILLLSTLALAWYCRKQDVVKNKIFVLTGIIVCSMLTGILLFYAGMPPIAQPVHLLLATFAITQTFYILLQVKVKQ